MNLRKSVSIDRLSNLSRALQATLPSDLGDEASGGDRGQSIATAIRSAATQDVQWAANKLYPDEKGVAWISRDATPVPKIYSTLAYANAARM
jgi:hypothetical protein